MTLTHRFKKISYFFQYLYEKVTRSIAFLPSIMALGFIVLIGFMIYMERNGLTSWMEARLPYFILIKSWDIASAVLTTLIGALISLMVFSFSMVMVLLNNAASNYSPRILPGLVADRFHQFVLGTYLGSIIYCIILVINMTPTQDKIPLPGFSVLFGIFLGINCLMLFVLFIHSISESVQVGKILERLHNDTIAKIDTAKAVVNEILTARKKILSEKATTSNNSSANDPEYYEFDPPPPSIANWVSIYADRSGHLHNINTKSLHQLCEKEDIRIRMLLPESRFVLEGSELLAVDKTISDKVRDEILQKLVINTYGRSETDYVVGFKFITEIAVKAMSPGINDPGTAISAIDYLTILFSKRMELPEQGAVRIKSKDGKSCRPVRLWLNIVSFDNLLTFVLAPIRQYAKHDLMVTLKLLDMLNFLHSRDYCLEDHRQIIRREALVIQEDAKEFLSNKADYNKVLTLLKQITNTPTVMS